MNKTWPPYPAQHYLPNLSKCSAGLDFQNLPGLGHTHLMLPGRLANGVRIHACFLPI